MLKAREASEGSTHDGLQAEIDAVRMRNTTILLKVKMLHSDILLLASDLCQPKDVSVSPHLLAPSGTSISARVQCVSFHRMASVFHCILF